MPYRTSDLARGPMASDRLTVYQEIQTPAVLQDLRTGIRLSTDFQCGYGRPDLDPQVPVQERSDANYVG
jgi:hypothetical protein